MTSEYSISVNDWGNEKWRHIGVDLMYNYYLEDKETLEECNDNGWDIEDIAHEKADSHYPMMLYAYPLNWEPEDNKIIEVCTTTNLTVVQDEETGDFFLALSGGGMDLSQDVALAYLIIEGRIPIALAINVNTQPELSVYGKNWLKVMRAIKKELRNEAHNCRHHIRKINVDIKRFKERVEARKQAMKQKN